MPEPVLELRGVRKSYGEGMAANEVLHGIDLTLARGEFVALMGPSGSGKSTLLNIVGLLDRPTSGALRIQGRETAALPEREVTRLRGHSIGFVFQYHHLIGAFSAVENVMMPLLLQRGRPDAAMRERAAKLLDRVGLAPWADRKVNLLADEPTGNLDTRSADGVFETMREVNRESGTAVLFVTHNPELARRCDRIATLVDGRIGAPAAARMPVDGGQPGAVPQREHGSVAKVPEGGNDEARSADAHGAGGGLPGGPGAVPGFRPEG